VLLWAEMPAPYDSELERLLDQARELLGAGDDAVLVDANHAVNSALQLHPDSVEGWLLKCQVASATGDDLAALAAVEMALRRAPSRAEALYWRGAVLGDLGRHREALRSIEAALRVIADGEHWLLEDLCYEKVLILDALGLHDAAVAACQAGLARCPGSPLLRAALAPAERARVKSSLRVIRGGA
jgi:tetratricopeptide (TPR) repeat protein